jgi:hypothetical protein
MKKVYLLLAAALCMVAFSCAKEEVESPAPTRNARRVEINASIELPDGMTKSTLVDNAFYWSVGDCIACYSSAVSNNPFQVSDPLRTVDMVPQGSSSDKARFIFTLQGSGPNEETPYLHSVAVFPVFKDSNDKDIKPTYNSSNDVLTITIPNTIAWVNGQVNNIQATTFSGGLNADISLQFYNVAGIIKFNLRNIPAGANQVLFTTGQKISGNFDIDSFSSTAINNRYISAGAESDLDSDGITFTFAAVTAEQVALGENNKVFYVPVPTGTYSQVGFKVKNSNGDILWQKTATHNNTVSRGTMLNMPALTYASASGGGEGNPANIISTASGQTGTVTLPSTTDDVLVEMHTTDGELTLEYAEGEGAKEPANVYVRVLKDATVNTLNINLPNSTVYVTGQENTNIGTLSSVTAANTLNVLASPLTIGKATINQGNVDIKGTVDAIVVADGATSNGQTATTTNQVQIAVSAEAAVKTITLNAVTDVVVEQPQGNIDASNTENKVYVIVNAAGSSAKAQNGGDIYVTANANCSVTATGVNEQDSTNNSTVVLENNTGGNNNVDTEQNGGGVVTTGSVKKAKIGSTEYASVAAAIAAVQNGQTITLLTDVTLTENPFFVALADKTVTLDLDGHTLFGRTNLTSGALTIQNGHVDCEMVSLSMFTAMQTALRTIAY